MDLEFYVLGLLGSLAVYLGDASMQRVSRKFAEGELNLDRLVEVRLEQAQKVDEALSSGQEYTDEVDAQTRKDLEYLAALDAGLELLEFVDLVVARLMKQGMVGGLKDKYHQNNLSFVATKMVLVDLIERSSVNPGFQAKLIGLADF